MRCNLYLLKTEWKSRNNPGADFWVVATSKKKAVEYYNKDHAKYYDLISVEVYGLFDGAIYAL